MDSIAIVLLADRFKTNLISETNPTKPPLATDNITINGNETNSNSNKNESNTNSERSLNVIALYWEA